MKVSFLEVAELELDEVYRYYETEQAGLGVQFLEQAALAISRVVEHPKGYQTFSARTRRCLIAKFPYGVLYEYNESGKEILIVAIGHLHREPDYWISRA
jgi:plasmid stabilization system protein ParE